MVKAKTKKAGKRTKTVTKPVSAKKVKPETAKRVEKKAEKKPAVKKTDKKPEKPAAGKAEAAKAERPLKKPAPEKRRLEVKEEELKAAVKKEEKPRKLGDKDIVFSVGKRKRSVARSSLRKGSGVVKINNKPLDLFSGKMAVMKIKEPLMLAGEEVKQFDISVNVKGGGVMGQADACRQAIAKGLVQVLGSRLKERFLGYDRSLLVYDPRRTEPHKPSRSSAGSRRHKQRSKR